MERDEAKVRFQDADRLFQTRQFTAALEILAELDRAFPNERHVLYPTARCLTGLKRYPEARKIAERLVRDFQYTPAQDLLDRIDRKSFDADDDALPGLPSALDEIMLTPASFGGPRPAAPAVRSSSGTWQPYALWIGLVFGGFIALVVFTLTVGRPVIDYVVDMFRNVEEYNADPASMPPLPLGPYFLVSFASSAYSWVICSLCGYAALRIVDALRFEDFGEDMKDVGLYTFYFFLIMLLPALLWMGLGEYGETIENGGTLLLLVAVGLLLQLTAWIIIVVILKRHWDLSFGKLVGVVLLFLVFAIGSTFVYAIAYYVIIIATLI